MQSLDLNFYIDLRLFNLLNQNNEGYMLFK